MRYLIVILVLVLPLQALADDRLVRLAAPQALVETDLFKYILPRFSLKTQVRVELVSPADTPHMLLGDSGRALFQQGETVWHMQVALPDHPGTARLADWLTGEVGQNTILAFAPDGAPLFTARAPVEQQTVALEMDGDAVLGHKVALAKCTRCHAVDEATRGAGIGSTPSFAVLRSLGDWEDRFQVFYVLNPHPAFTIIDEVTPPFDATRPSPIVPIQLTLDEVEAMLAYVAAMPPADLGGPLVVD